MVNLRHEILTFMLTGLLRLLFGVLDILSEISFFVVCCLMGTRFGATNISQYEALRHILTYRKEGCWAMVGFISAPLPIHCPQVNLLQTKPCL